MFSNVNQFIFPVCQESQTKEFHYSALIEHNMIPVVYIPKDKYEDNDMFNSINQQFPTAIGVVVAIQYLNDYE